MAPYKPTGRPVGRPPTSDLHPLSVKVPQELLHRVKRYAGLHRQSLSALVREGLEWRITEGDPRGRDCPPAEQRAEREVFYYDNTEIPKADNTVILEELQNLKETVQALERRLAYQHPDSEPDEENSHTVLPKIIQEEASPRHPMTYKAQMVARIESLSQSGMSLEAIARKLNAEHRATLSGKGTWSRGTVSKLLRKYTTLREVTSPAPLAERRTKESTR